MKNELDSIFVLSTFEKIKQFGQRNEEQYVLDGVTAYTDFDGYTLFMEDAQVQLSYGFHNQYLCNYEQQEHLDAFMRKLKHIEKSY